MKKEIKTFKSGQTVCITIPKIIADNLELGNKTELVLELKGEKIIITKKAV